MQPSDDVIERLLSLQEAVAREARLQEFVHGVVVLQHGKVSHEDLIGQQRFPDKLPDPGVTYTRVLQDYDPEPPFRAQYQRDRSVALGALITCFGSLIRMCAPVSRRCLACITNV